HPGVVTVYDVAEDEGRPWIVMQLISAQSLDQVLATSGPLSPRRAAEMGRQLLSALTVAHAAGVMHRDVKPSNVLLGRDDRAVLTDFGIATFQGDPRLTQTGMVMGSPGFTAPERIRGEDASPASDLWSLGATLFAAVEGHGPFEKRGGAVTTMSAIINEDAPEAQTAGALGPVIAALLRREPADRPDAGSAARMITDVLPLLTDRPAASAGGYVPTAISASPPLKPPEPVRPRAPQSGETALDFGSVDKTISRDPVGQATTGPAGGQPTPEQTAPTAPQALLGGAGQSGASQGGFGQGGPGQSGPGPGGFGQSGSAGWSSGYAPGSESSARPEGPPPDFSSWYDPSPRSGPAAPQGYGPRPQSGSEYSSPSASGYRPGPPSGSGYQSPPSPGYAPVKRQSSGLGWKIAIVVLALIGVGAGVATVLLLHHNSSATSTAPAPASSPPQIIDAINQAPGALPAGYATYSQPAAGSEKAGFSLAAPTSWKASVNGYQT